MVQPLGNRSNESSEVAVLPPMMLSAAAVSVELQQLMENVDEYQPRRHASMSDLNEPAIYTAYSDEGVG